MQGFFLSVQGNFAVHFFRREEQEDIDEAALEVIVALDIARGKNIVIPVPSKGITAEERLRLKWYNKSISQKSRVGFNMWVQPIGTSAVYQNVIYICI